MSEIFSSDFSSSISDTNMHIGGSVGASCGYVSVYFAIGEVAPICRNSVVQVIADSSLL